MNKRLFKTRSEFRKWLEKNHEKETEIWLIFYKVKSGKLSVKYHEAVEEALCFGWIDSVVRRIDDEKHMQRYSPRKPRSVWAESNKKRVADLIKRGKMRESGIKMVEIAKKNGMWDKINEVDLNTEVPAELETAFKTNSKAKALFGKLSPSRRKQFIWWIRSAKRNETIEKRVKETLRLLEENKSPGI